MFNVTFNVTLNVTLNMCPLSSPGQPPSRHRSCYLVPMHVRVGFLHRRERIRLELPVGCRLTGALASEAAAGPLLIEGFDRRSARVRPGLKLLECADADLLATAAGRLNAAGLPARVLPFAPGGRWGAVRAPETKLLWLPLGEARPAGDEDHLQRDLGDDDDRRALAGARQALGDLAGRPSGQPPPALWHLASAQRHWRVVEVARTRVRLRAGDGPDDSPLEFCACQALSADDLPALRIEAQASGRIRVDEVEIGIGFHWEHRRGLEYESALELFVDSSGRLGLLNELDLERYLASVNSSEMTADCPPALLEAQTVAARSTVLATRGRHHCGEPFDLCSDDHCQCFRGAGQPGASSISAAEATRGQVLVHEGWICDARYSKSCGGIVEAYEEVWEDQPVPYLRALCDSEAGGDPPERDEDAWRDWIDVAEPVWCNTEGAGLPAGLAYGQGYYRWTVERERADLAASIRRRTGRSFERLLDLKPLSRGRSGRLTALEVVTDTGSFTIGKELAIRLALSDSCLYSAAIHWTWSGDTLRIHGKGWGHGVGLCQLGATRMALAGRGAPEILAHYYPGARLRSLPAAERTAP